MIEHLNTRIFEYLSIRLVAQQMHGIGSKLHFDKVRRTVVPNMVWFHEQSIRSVTHTICSERAAIYAMCTRPLETMTVLRPAERP